MSGHLTCTVTLSKSRHIPTLNYLRSADTCLTRARTVMYWLSVHAITDSANKCHVFGGHFNLKSLTAHTLTCDQQFVQMSMLPSGDRKQYFISRVLRDEPRDCGNSDHFGCISFTTSRHKNHVFYFKPAKLKKVTILSFDKCASRRALAVELVRQNTNSTYRSKQSGHKEPSWPTGIRTAGLV